MANRLKEKYTNEVIPALTEKFNYSSVMAGPKNGKIVSNMGYNVLKKLLLSWHLFQVKNH